MPTLSQAALPLDLDWTLGNPVHMTGVLVGRAALAGPITVVSDNPTLQAHLAITLVADNADAIVTVDLAQSYSLLLSTGTYEYRGNTASGVTAIEGTITILAGASTATNPGPNLSLITSQDVFDWMGTPSTTDGKLTQMDKVVKAVITRISRSWEAPEVGGDDDWILAHIMQCARIWKRALSPEGVIASDQFGTIRVTRIDVDIADMLTDFAKAPFA